MLLVLGTEAQELRLITKLPPVVPETSGIEESGTNKVWTFNDSGGKPEIYLCDTLGKLLKTVEIIGARNRDWEDITKDDQGFFYIGDFGNNDNDRSDLIIYRIANPDTLQGNSVESDSITFHYEDQQSFPPPPHELHFDCEAMFWHEGSIFLCTKNRTDPFDGDTHLYRISDQPGTYSAEKIATFHTGGSNIFECWITAADMSPDGSKLALLSGNRIWIFSHFANDDFFGGTHQEIPAGVLSQKEAICFVSETELYITDEELFGGLGRNLYSLSIEPKTIVFNHDPRLDRVLVYPNPCQGGFIIEGLQPNHRIELLDQTGLLLLDLPTTSHSLKTTSTLNDAGIFLIRITDLESGAVQVRKIINMR